MFDFSILPNKIRQTTCKYFICLMVNKYAFISEKLLMLLNFLDSTSLIAKSFSRIIATKLFNQSRCVPCYISREFNCIDTFQDDIVGSHWVGTGKRRCALFKKYLLRKNLNYFQKKAYLLIIQTLTHPKTKSQH